MNSMKQIPLNKEVIKILAKNMHEYFKEHPESEIKLSHCYGALSRAFGHQSWNHFLAFLNKIERNNEPN